MLYPDDSGGSIPVLPIILTGGVLLLVIALVPSPNLSGAGEDEDGDG
jgi:hypothetical protein